MALMSRNSSIRVVLKMLVVSASIFFAAQPSRTLGQSSPTARSAELEAGIKLVEQHRDFEAVKILKKATSTNKTDSEAWFYLGVAYVGLLDIKEATKSFETAIELAPQFADAHLALSDAYLRQSRLQLAANEAERALSLRPNNPYAHFTHAFTNFRRGSFEDAVTDADLAIKQKSDFAEAYLLKAQALLGRYPGPASTQDEEAKVRNEARYRSAAEPLKVYVGLVRDSENSRIWRDAIDVLSQFSYSDRNDARTGRQVDTKARLISKPEPMYTEQARQYQVEGTVILRVVFASDANVKNIHIAQALPAGLTEQAVKAARRIQFIPATLDGKPVSMWMQLEYNFYLY